MRKSKKDKESKKIKEKDSKRSLKEKDSKKNLQEEAAKPEAEVKPEGLPKDQSGVCSPTTATKTSGKVLLSTYENWNRDKWSMAASEITKGLRSWNFKVQYLPKLVFVTL